MKTSRDAKKVPSRPTHAAGPIEVVTTDDIVTTPHDVVVTPAERDAMIAEVAYGLAEARGFEPGHELEDWLTAERAVDGRIARQPHE